MEKLLQIGARRRGGNLGTFGGVFTPSVLTILGIILFRRLGYVVGSAGLERALVIIGLSSVISVLTAFSLSAIATNLKVKGGGPYYLISRTLGVEFGGAIGLVLFLAQSVSIAFYCIGFSEAVVGILPMVGGSLEPVLAGLAVAFLFAFAWLGADWATRLQYLILTILVFALISFFAGGMVHWDGGVLGRNWQGPSTGSDFWIIFAIFFPAVTGFTQGVSMSGDLKEPGRSIQHGTLWAVGVSIAVYLGAAVLFAAALPNEELVTDYESMRRISRIDWLIDAGVIAATLSSAMASFLGAPRILQSIGQDRIFPFLLPFAQGFGPANNPRRGVLLSGGIALLTIGLGNLNLIAPLVSMFFLISYGLLNYATFYEARAASPSFRPRFRLFHRHLSLLGALGCLGIMLAINPPASAAALAILFGIHQYLKRTAGPARWADSRHAHHFQVVRENLLELSRGPEHPRDWRPCILAFCDDPHRREQLLRFASWIEGGTGLTTAVRIVEGEGQRAMQARDKVEKELHAQIEESELKIFVRVLAAPDFRVGVETLLQSFGIGGIRANMVLLSKVEQLPWQKDSQGEVRFGRELHEAIHLGCNVVVLDSKDDEWAQLEKSPPSERRIDVWWWGDKTSQLMLLLAYLMTRVESWDGAKIRVLAPGSKEETEKSLANLKQTLEEVRIEAEPEIVSDLTPQAVVERSQDASLVFFPLYFRESQLLGPQSKDFEYLADRLPLVVFSLAAQDVDLDAEPEEGEAAEAAAILDAASDAEKEAAQLQKDAEKLSEIVEEKRRSLTEKNSTGASEEELRELEAALRQTEEQAREVAQKYAKARARAEAAREEAKSVAGKQSEKSQQESTSGADTQTEKE